MKDVISARPLVWVSGTILGLLSVLGAAAPASAGTTVPATVNVAAGGGYGHGWDDDWDHCWHHHHGHWNHWDDDDHWDDCDWHHDHDWYFSYDHDGYDRFDRHHDQPPVRLHQVLNADNPATRERGTGTTRYPFFGANRAPWPVVPHDVGVPWTVSGPASTCTANASVVFQVANAVHRQSAHQAASSGGRDTEVTLLLTSPRRTPINTGRGDDGNAGPPAAHDAVQVLGAIRCWLRVSILVLLWEAGCARRRRPGSAVMEPGRRRRASMRPQAASPGLRLLAHLRHEG